MSEEEEEASPVELAVTAMLIGTVAFGMSLFYLVNNSDCDIRQHSWEVISSTIAIFAAVLVYQGIHGVVQGFVQQSSDSYDLAEDTREAVLIFTKAVEVLVWYSFQNLIIYKEASNIDKSPHAAHTLEVEQRLKCWSTLFGHVSAFAAISGGTYLQHLGCFSGSWYWMVVPVLLVAGFWFVLFRFADWVRSIFEAHESETSNVCNLWGEHSEEAENEVGGLSISFLLVHALVSLCTGIANEGGPGSVETQHGNEEREKEHGHLSHFNRHETAAPYMAEMQPIASSLGLTCFACLFTAMTVALVFWTQKAALLKTEEQPHGQSRGRSFVSCPASQQAMVRRMSQGGWESIRGFDKFSDYLLRWYFIVHQCTAMCIAWCVLHAAGWEVQRFLFSHAPNGGTILDEKSTSQHVFLALSVSFFSFVCIFMLDYLQDLPLTGDTVDVAILKIIKSIAILIGFSWEEAFHAGVGQVASLAGSFWLSIFTKLVLGIAVGFIVVPAWRWYILRTVIKLRQEVESGEVSAFLDAASEPDQDYQADNESLVMGTCSSRGSREVEMRRWAL